MQIRRLPKPVVAMVAGYAVGGGHVLHMICDLTVRVSLRHTAVQSAGMLYLVCVPDTSCLQPCSLTPISSACTPSAVETMTRHWPATSMGGCCCCCLLLVAVSLHNLKLASHSLLLVVQGMSLLPGLPCSDGASHTHTACPGHPGSMQWRCASLHACGTLPLPVPGQGHQCTTLLAVGVFALLRYMTW